MATTIFNRDTLLNIAVNIVPLVIIAFYVTYLILFFPVSNQWLIEATAIGLHVVPFVILAVITYIAARAVEL